MIIITLCTEHGLRIWENVKCFVKFQAFIQSFGACEIDYYLLESGEIPNDFDRVEYNGTDSLVFYSNNEQQTSLGVGKKPWYSMTSDERSSVYSASELADIATALGTADYTQIEMGMLPKPAGYPIIPVKEIESFQEEIVEEQIGTAKVRAL